MRGTRREPIGCDPRRTGAQSAPRTILAAAALAIAPGVAGCFSDRGLAIEVDVGTTGATAVELFIGAAPCDGGDNPAGIDCKAIAPPPAPGLNALRGDIWFRDDLALDTAVVKGHTAAFQLKADTATAIPIVIAVGLTDPGGQAIAAATLRDVTVPINSARVATTTLVAANPVQPGTTVARNVTEDRVLVWRKTMPASACVVVEHWEGGTATRSFVVPREDPDCDDVVNECNPAAYHGTEPPGTAPRVDCLSSDPSACVLGSRACVDDGPRTGVCGPQHDNPVCVPDLFCGCTDIDETCLQMPLRNAPAMVPHIDCTFPTQGSLLTVCPNKDTAMIQLDHFAATETCEQPLIASLALTGFATSASFGAAVMEVMSPQQPCSFPIRWKTGGHAADVIDLGAIKVRGSSASVVIPIVLRFNGVPGTGCVDALSPSCQLKDVATDGLWTCAR